MPFFPFLHGLIVTMKYVRVLREQESAGTKRLSHSKEKQRKQEIWPIDQLWMFQFLTRVRLGLFERDLTHGFDVTTVCDVVVACANYLYILLGSLPVRPSEGKLKEHLPDLFQGKYEIVQGILDCTELKCEPSKGFQKDSEMYSDYKSHDTFKGPVCISSSGWITVVSHLYPGRICNKDNCREKQFLSTN